MGGWGSCLALSCLSALLPPPPLFPSLITASPPPHHSLVKGRLERISDGLKRRWRNAFPRDVEVLPQTQLPVALTLLERSNIGGAFLKYRFAFPRPNQMLELDLGQQISLIGSTPEDRVMRAAFIPLSDRDEPGFLELVSEKNNPDDPSVRILDTLAIGETIQVR